MVAPLIELKWKLKNRKNLFNSLEIINDYISMLCYLILLYYLSILIKANKGNIKIKTRNNHQLFVRKQ
jgi:hypothetical protein